MARTRRSTRAAARTSGTARSQRAEAERPAASRRASAAAANRKSAQAPAAETEESAATGDASGPQPQTPAQDALEPAAGQSARAEGGTSRRAKAQSAGSSRQDKAKDKDKDKASGRGSSRRAKAQGGGRSGSSRRQADAKSGSRRAKAQSGTARSTRRMKEVDPKAGLKQKIKLGVISAVLLLVVGGLLLWPGIRRGMILSDLDAASDATSAQAIADEYLAYVSHNFGRVQGAITAGRGPASARIHMAQQVESPDLLLVIGLAPELSDDDRAAALDAAASLIQDGTDSATYVDQDQLQEWAVQSQREEKHPALAMAAAHLIAARETDNAAEVLTGVIRSPDQHPAILAAAITHLPTVIDSSNAGFALQLVTSANNDAVLESEPLMQATTTAVRAAHIDRIFELLDHEDARVQAAGARFLSGNGIATTGKDQAESIGQRISPYLTAEMRREKPEVFAEALKVVSALSLTGARDQLIAMLGEVPPESEDATLLAQILGRNFVRKDDGYQQISNDVLTGIAAAMDLPAARETAASALQQVTVRELPALRIALEACIAHGSEPACMDAAHHIVGELYQRDDVIAKYGRDVTAWQTFLRQDRPRFEEYQGIQAWIGEYAGIRVADGMEKIKQGRVDCDRYTQLLGSWLEPGGEPMPLGLTEPMVKKTMNQLKQVQYSLIKATPGL